MPRSPRQPERTDSGTFRIADKVYKAMQKQATQNKTSLNALLNQILYQYYFESMPEMKPLFVVVAKSIFSALIADISDEDAKRIGQVQAEEAAESMMLARHGSITTETVLELSRDFARRGGYGRYTEVSEGGKLIVTLVHDFGRKGSIMFASAGEQLFRMGGVQPKITTTDEAVVIEI